MHNFLKKTLSVLVLILIAIVTYSQASTISPYTRYGVGELNSVSFGRSNALGDIYTTLRAPSQINIGNPASFSAQDTVSFIFDVGITSKYTGYNINDDKLDFATANLDHIAIGFPVTRRFKVSAGIYPYSFIGYDISNTAKFEEDTTYSTHNTNSGNGGLNKLYLGGGYEIIDGLSVGVSGNFIFGNIDYINQSSVYFSDLESAYTFINILKDESKTRINGLSIDLGLQYAYEISKNQKIHVGATYSPKMKLKSEYNKQVYKDNVLYYKGAYSSLLGSDTLKPTLSSGTDPVAIPSKFSVGIAYEFINKLYVGFDYSSQAWGDFNYPTISSNYLKNFNQYSIGVEYIPNAHAFTGYYNVMQYRLGGYIKENYIYLGDTQITDRGITAGVGLPMGGKTMINLSYKYGIRGTTNNDLVKESYNQFNIGFSFYDFWFIKSKYD